MISSDDESATARSMAFSSSRTLPGQWYADRRASVSRAKPLIGFPDARAYCVEEVLGQQRNVVEALPERRERDGHDVQPIVEVLPVAALLHPLPEIAVRGRDDPHAHGDPVVAADAPDGLLLERPQELRLQRRRQLADLVQEARAAGRRLEEPAPRRQRAR